MKAAVFTQYGRPKDVIRLSDAPKPTPADNEVLIKVHASSVNAAQVLIVQGTPLLVRMTTGLFKPSQTIQGADIAGRVEAVGSKVTKFRPGDEVFGDLSSSGWGAFAEYACGREDALVLKPSNVSFEQAAATPLAAITALQSLRKGKIQAGQKVLVNGASGGVGSFAVQIAKAYGAEVTAVGATQKLDMLRTLGADHIIDYKREDITRSGKRYDLIIDAAAYRPFREYRQILSPKGTYLLVGGKISLLFRTMIFGPLSSKSGGQSFGVVSAGVNADDLAELKTLLETGKMIPAIDRCFPLAQTAEAMEYVLGRQVQGKVVITIANN